MTVNWRCSLLFLALFLDSVYGIQNSFVQATGTPVCNYPYTCIPTSMCAVRHSDGGTEEVLFQCEEKKKVCCPPPKYSTPVDTSVSSDVRKCQMGEFSRTQDCIRESSNIPQNVYSIKKEKPSVVSQENEQGGGATSYYTYENQRTTPRPFQPQPPESRRPSQGNEQGGGTTNYYTYENHKNQRTTARPFQYQPPESRRPPQGNEQKGGTTNYYTYENQNNQQTTARPFQPQPPESRWPPQQPIPSQNLPKPQKTPSFIQRPQNSQSPQSQSPNLTPQVQPQRPQKLPPSVPPQTQPQRPQKLPPPVPSQTPQNYYPNQSRKPQNPPVPLQSQNPYNTENDPPLTSHRNFKLLPSESHCGVNSFANRITEGEEVSLGEYPWMVLTGLKDKYGNSRWNCGGTLINEWYVLTAAHCLIVDNRTIEFVRLGEHSLTNETDCFREVCLEPPEDIPIAEVIPHEKWNTTTIKNDIALLRLSRNPLKLGKSNIYPICLPLDMEKLNITTSTKYEVAGWGKTDWNADEGSDVLRKASISGVNREECNICKDKKKQQYCPITNTQLCVQGWKSVDVCKGDSGGPLMVTRLNIYQIGITSFKGSEYCGAENIPSIFTRVESYLPWILDNIRD